MPGDPKRDARPRPEDYPLERVREQWLKATEYFRKALEAHGCNIASTDRGGVVMIVARDAPELAAQTGLPLDAAERLRDFCKREHVTYLGEIRT